MNRTIADFTYDDKEMADLVTEGMETVGFQGVMGFIKFNAFHDYQANGMIYQQKGTYTYHFCSFISHVFVR